MFQKFEVIKTKTDLFHRKISVVLSLAPDESTVTKDTIYIGEEDTGRILNFNIEINDNIIDLNLLEWPKPNIPYVLFVQKGIRSITEDELDASLRRNLVFNSDITSTVEIISPCDNEKIKSLDINWTEKTKEPGSKNINSYYVEVSSDNGFFNIVKSTKILNKQNISLTDIKNGQYFIRIRAQKDELYGRWSDIVTFYFLDNNYSSSSNIIDSDNSQAYTDETNDTSPILDINLLSGPDNGVTPTESAVLNFDQNIDINSIKDLILYSVTDAVVLECKYTVNGKSLIITPIIAFASNKTYKVTIGYMKSTSGSFILDNYSYTFTTALSPLYCTVQDVNSVIGSLCIDDASILYYINQASLMVDWINSQGSASSTTLTAPYDYEVVQFTKYKAAKEALLNAMVNRAGNDGTKGMLLDIQFEFDNGTKSLKDVLKNLSDEVMKWQEAVRGYGPEGRQKPIYDAVKGSKSSSSTNSISSLVSTYDRSTSMNGGI